MPGAPAVSRSRRTAPIALAGYAAISFLYLGVPPLVESGHQYIGWGYDPQIFIWGLAWWPHAVLHGENPFITHVVWSPDGVNTMWATTAPGLALLYSPLTFLLGPILSFDIAAVLAPALAAWTAFLLCRYLTGSLWPSLVGGYLFGFSSYLVGEVGFAGNVNLGAVFLLPLVALVILRYLDGQLGGRGLALRLGPMLALQFLISEEVTLTLTLALAGSLPIAFAVAPGRRHRLVSLLAPLAGAYALAGVLVAPFLYYALTGIPSGAFVPPNSTLADLANYVIPSKAAAVGGGALSSVSRRFTGNPRELGAYLGLPALVIGALYVRERWRTPACRFLVLTLLLAVVAALGGRATVAGRALFDLPWSLVNSVRLFDRVQTARIAVYSSLVVAVIVALWMARRGPGVLRWLLPALAVVSLVPNPRAGAFATRYHVPTFFTAAAYRSCIDQGETVLPFPIRGGNSLLWQVDRGFRFRMAGGDIGPDIPPSFFTPGNDQVAGGLPLHADQVGVLRAFIREKHVTSVVVDGSHAGDWTEALDPIATPQSVGGVVLYHLRPHHPPCPGA